MPTIVEEFDDDTDLPLPSQPLPHTGSRGPILEAISSDEDDLPTLGQPSLSSQSASATHPAWGADSSSNHNTVTDITPYKKWSCIYPIYIDAKRPYGMGERRIPRAKSVWWPLSKDIADAASRLGFSVLHEMHKTHPRDWENPGRVRVQWKKDSRLVNPAIETKRLLLEAIALQIQRSKPDNAPKPPFTLVPLKPVPLPSAKAAKGKHSAPKAKVSTAPPASRKSSGRRLPMAPPDLQPPLASRVSPYSPASPSGVLIETVKAGMNAQEGGPGAGPGGLGAGGMGKGKRKVVRVRG